MPERIAKIKGIKVGYTKASDAVNNVFNFIISLGLILLASPLFIIVAIVIYIQDRGPILYSGVRLGRNKKHFRMYKFRTLVPEADKMIGAELFSFKLSSNRELLSPTGKFMRDTRLDEIPQLFNTLKGDMNLLGPRPVRPEVYDKFCRNIKGYDKRFSVKPGLIGFSQLFTPHSTPKKIRNLIDNKFLKIKHRYTTELLVVMATLLLLTYRMVVKLLGIARNALKSIFSGYDDKRFLDRSQPRNVEVRVVVADSDKPPSFEDATEVVLEDINDEAMCICSGREIAGESIFLQLKLPVRRWRRPGRKAVMKTAVCRGAFLYRKKKSDGMERHCYVIKYQPISPFNFYIVNQYFLNGSLMQA